jgi:small subunit ribosomal protein S20
MTKALVSIEAGDAAVAEDTAQQAISILDRAVRKGILHKNSAARRKSRIAIKLNRLLSP